MPRSFNTAPEFPQVSEPSRPCQEGKVKQGQKILNLCALDGMQAQRIIRMLSNTGRPTLLYCIVFKYLYSAPQQPWANRGAFGSISSKKRDKI